VKPLLPMYLHVGQVHYHEKYKETFFACTAVGMSGTTKVFVRETVDDAAAPLFTARMGIAIFGITNRKDPGLAAASPFDPDFRDNFVEGTGPTEAAALDAMKQDLDNLSRMLFL